MSFNNLFTIVLLGLLLQTTVYARSNDKHQPLNIEADSVELQEKTGTGIYKGKVKITQGSTLFTGDSIIVYAKKNEVEKILITGSPAKFSQTNNKNEKIEASSYQMTYLASKEQLILKNQARIKQGDNLFQSEHIIYDTANDTVSAGDQTNTPDDETSRVKITITPSASSETAEQPALEQNTQPQETVE